MRLRRLKKTFYLFSILHMFVLLAVANTSVAKSSKEASDAAMLEASKFEANDDLTAAINVLLKHLVENGSDPVASSKLSDILIQKGDFSKAYRIARIVRRYYPDYDWPYILQFKSALELKKFTAAQKIFKKFRTVATTVNRDQLKGDYYRLKGDLFKADDYYEKAFKSQKKDKSLLDLRLWNLKNAIAASIEKKDFSTAETAVARLLKISAGKQKAESLEISADLRIRQGKFELAEKDLSEILRSTNNLSVKEKLSDLRVTLASQAYAARNIDLTEKWLNLADSLGPSYHSFILRGNIRRDEGNYELAEQLYDKAKKLKKDDATLFEAMAWNYTQWTRYQDAEESIIAAIELEPSEPRYRVIHANQLKNGRKLSKALGELITARRLCEVAKDCDSFDEIYDERFFENTDAEGFSLDVVGIPATITSGLGYREDPSDLVGVSRGLAAQNVKPNDYSLFLTPSKSPIAFGRVQLGYYKAEKPFISGYFERSEKIGDKRETDPTVALRSQVFSLETEGSFPLPFLGVISVFPYLKFINNESHAFDTKTISGQYVNSSEYIVGTRGLWQFRWYLPALEGEVGVGRVIENSKTNFSTTRARLGLQQNFTKYLRFLVDGTLYNKRSSGSLLQSQIQALTRLTLLPLPYLGLSCGYQLLSTNDQKISSPTNSESRAITHHRTSSVGISLGSGENFKLASTLYKSTIDPYRIYDNESVNTEMEFALRPRLNRDIGGNRRLPYLAPVRLILGHNIQVFATRTKQEDVQTPIKRKTLPSYYAATKLFW